MRLPPVMLEVGPNSTTYPVSHMVLDRETLHEKYPGSLVAFMVDSYLTWIGADAKEVGRLTGLPVVTQARKRGDPVLTVEVHRDRAQSVVYWLVESGATVMVNTGRHRRQIFSPRPKGARDWE